MPNQTDISMDEMIEDVCREFAKVSILIRYYYSLNFIMEMWLPYNHYFREMYEDFFSSLKFLLAEENLESEFQLAIRFNGQDKLINLLKKSTFVTEFLYDNLCEDSWFFDLEKEYKVFEDLFLKDYAKLRWALTCIKRYDTSTHFIIPTESFPDEALVIDKLFSLKESLTTCIQHEDNQWIFTNWFFNEGSEFADSAREYGLRFEKLLRAAGANFEYKFTLSHMLIGGRRQMRLFLHAYPEIFEFFATELRQENSLLDRMHHSFMKFLEKPQPNFEVEMKKDREQVSRLLLEEKYITLSARYPENFKLFAESVKGGDVTLSEINFSYDNVSQADKSIIEKYKFMFAKILSEDLIQLESIHLAPRFSATTKKEVVDDGNKNLKKFYAQYQLQPFQNFTAESKVNLIFYKTNLTQGVSNFFKNAAHKLLYRTPEITDIDEVSDNNFRSI